ncbi:MAG: HDOD domain-containing protein [Desulfobacteraceae bacterium]|nr:HDOD domain-containing protein [Desulfobacteraceae bacterium]
MDIYVARQPILDRQQRTVAYELLFRDGLENSFPDMDGDTATFRLLSNTFFSMGINWISMRKPVFINFPQALIEHEIPLFFPKKNVVIEVLEDVNPDKKVIRALTRLKKKGFRIVLDDFLYSPELTPLIRNADIVKFDFRGSSIEEIEKMMTALSGFPNLKFLAEKIETHGEFKKALEMGFHFFQGYFFEKPMILTNKSIPVVKISLIRLIAQVSVKEIDFSRLTRMIREDVSISFRLLKFINSAYYRRTIPVDSVKDAVTLMGEREIKKFILLIASAGLAAGKPKEIVATAIITGRMCELLGQEVETGFSDEELFTLGLFRNIDAMLDMPMEEVLRDLPFTRRIKQALLGRNKELAQFFGVITDFMRGDWENLRHHSRRLSIPVETMKDAYRDAVTMADEFLAINPK